MRRVGWPTPTGTDWPSLPQTPTPESSAMSLPTTALGAAYLAGLATGVWRDTAEIAAQWQRERVFEPAMGNDEREARLARWRSAVGRTREWEVD